MCVPNVLEEMFPGGAEVMVRVVSSGVCDQREVFSRGYTASGD